MSTDLLTSVANMIGFTEADLAANRLGKLSDRQRGKLAAQQREWLIPALVTIGGGTILVFFTIVGIDADTSNLRLAFALIIVAFLVGYLAYEWVKWSRLKTDLTNVIVLESQGRLEPITYSGKSSPYYFIRVKDVKFPIDEVLFNLLTDLAEDYPYCVVYYAPQSHVLLSFEVLDRIS
jgi:hypothetical protein